MSAVRRIGLLLAALVLFGGPLAAGLVAWRAHRSLSDRPEDFLGVLSRAVGLPVEAEEVRVTWWPPGVTLEGVSIPDLSPLGPGRLARAGQARLIVRAGHLLLGRVVVRRVEIDSPVIRVVRGTDGSWNFAAATIPASTDVAGAEGADGGALSPDARFVPADAPDLDVVEVLLSGGRISLRDRAIPGVPEFELTAAEGRLVRGEQETTLVVEGTALGGPAGNVRGTLRAPHDGSAIEWDAVGAALSASRLPELLQLVRGQIPFRVELDGQLGAELSGRFASTWPPAGGTVAVVVEADEASAEAAGGYLRKSQGEPLRIALSLVTEAEGLRVARATFESAPARLEFVSSEDDEGGAAGKTLQIESLELDAQRLARWVPILAALQPTGAVALEGTLGAGGDGPVADLRLAGAGLGVQLGAVPAQVGAAAVEIQFVEEGAWDAAVSIEELRSEDIHAHRLFASLHGDGDEPLQIRFDGERGGRAGAELDRMVVECAVGPVGTDVRRLDVAGLGGRLTATGGWTRDAEDRLEARFAPQWDGLDFAGVLRLFGFEADVQGLVTGRAALQARGHLAEGLWETLTGDFEALLVEAGVENLNLARVTLDNLGVIPGLREAVEKRAEEKVPGLLAQTSRIDSLSVGGAVGEGRVSLSTLRLDAPDYVIDADGEVAFDGAVDLDGELILGNEATDALLASSGILGALATPGERLRIPIAIEGVYPDLVSAPSPAFLRDSVRREGGRNAAGFLRRLLGGGSKPPAAGSP